MNQFLLYKYKIIGFAIVILGLGLTGAYFLFDLRIELPVFAIVSSFIETKFFTVFKTNVTEEIILLLFIIGFSLIVFSKVKNEKNWVFNIRIKSLGYTIIVYLIWLVFTTLFIFGSAYVSTLIISTLLPFVIYISIFYYLYYKTCKRRRIRILQQKLFNSQARES